MNDHEKRGNRTSGPVARGFPAGEFEERLNRSQRLMKEKDLAALLLTTEPEFRYFSGFLTQFWQSPTRPWFLIVPAAGKPIAVIPEIGAAAMQQTWLDDIRTWPAPVPEDEGVTLLGQTLRESAGRTGRVGVPMGPETHLRMPLADFERLRDASFGGDFVDASAVIRDLRMVKSKAEIAKIAHICDLVCGAFEWMPHLAAEGEEEREVFRAFKMEILRRGADDVPYLVGGAGPGGYDDIISPPSDRTLQEGDVLMLDTGSVYDGYFCDFDRNFCVGNVADATRRAHDILYRATEAAMRAAVPGASCADLFRSMWQVIDAGGGAGSATGRLGHGLGMQLTEWPSLTPNDHTVLRAGMVITLEPGLAIAPGKTMVHEENIVIGEDGPQLLTRRAPREPVVIGT